MPRKPCLQLLEFLLLISVSFDSASAAEFGAEYSGVPNLWTRFAIEERSWFNQNSDGLSIELFECQKHGGGTASISLALSLKSQGNVSDETARLDYSVGVSETPHGRIQMFDALHRFDEYFGEVIEFTTKMNDLNTSSSVLICSRDMSNTNEYFCYSFVSLGLERALEAVCSEEGD